MGLTVLASLDGGPPRRLTVTCPDPTCSDLYRAAALSFGLPVVQLVGSVDDRKVEDCDAPAALFAPEGCQLQLRSLRSGDVWQIAADGSAFSPACRSDVESVVEALARLSSGSAARETVLRLYGEAAKRRERVSAFAEKVLQAQRPSPQRPKRAATGEDASVVDRLFKQAQADRQKLEQSRRDAEAKEREMLKKHPRLTPEQLEAMAKRLCTEPVEKRRQANAHASASPASPRTGRRCDVSKLHQWSEEGARSIAKRTKAEMQRRERGRRWTSDGCRGGEALTPDNVARYAVLRSLIDHSDSSKGRLVCLPGSNEQHPYQGKPPFVPTDTKGLAKRNRDADVSVVFAPDREPVRSPVKVPRSEIEQKMVGWAEEGSKRLVALTKEELLRRERVYGSGSPARTASPNRSWETVHRHQQLRMLRLGQADGAAQQTHEFASKPRWMKVTSADISRQHRDSDRTCIFAADAEPRSPRARRYDPEQVAHVGRETAASRAKRCARTAT
eukprot:TRINITY_DN9602_c0_g1_i1.p1 TRINITY_DN9602_c0_g1~~TRINITY_DN9602_c0_g1_i1.p1  ORF type:complete len:521 (+),score=165.26 TRINITY_DN9602_c0_g1_i1:60-1565(+)